MLIRPAIISASGWAICTPVSLISGTLISSTGMVMRPLRISDRMEEIVETEGEDYRDYSADSKKVIASCASVAVSVKSVLDTPLLTDDGVLTDESGATTSSVEGFLNNMRIDY